jgi:hypothetical protein
MKPIVIYSLKVWVTFAVLSTLFTNIYIGYTGDKLSLSYMLEDFVVFLIGSIPFCLYLFGVTWILWKVKKTALFIKTLLCITEIVLTFLLFWYIIRGVDYRDEGIGKMVLMYGKLFLFPLLISIPLSIWPYRIYTNAK